jgi:DNA-binding transcriptional regulator YhcF (GntR family)
METAYHNALCTLQNLIGEYRSRGEKRLPTLSRLSAIAGVSVVTMWKIVRQLKAEGVLSACRGRWIEITGMPPDRSRQTGLPVVDGTIVSARWARVYERMQKDFINGHFPPGSLLPSQKELVRRYGVCSRTLKKALEKCVEREWLVPYNRTYRIAGSNIRAKSSGKVVCMFIGDSEGKVFPYTPRIQEYIRILEFECSRNDVAFEIRTFDPRLSRTFIQGKLMSPAETSSNNPALGYMVITMGESAPAFLDEIARLSSLDIPMSILDETGDIPFKNINRQPKVKIFTIANTKSAGERVGRYLLRLGHKRIAFTSLYEGEVWSKNRLQGLIDVYDEAGLREGIKVFTSGQTRRFVEYSMQAQNMSTIINAMTMPEDFRLKDKTIMKYIDLIHRKIGSLYNELVNKPLMPLFNEMLRDRSVTAWVGANDVVALSMVHFLRGQKIQVPRKMSVIGFDDSQEAFLNKLTSYNFNYSTLISAMLQYLLSPGSFAHEGKGSSMIEIDGFITVRESVRKI